MAAEIILIEENAPFLQKVPSVTDDLDASLGVVAFQLSKNLVVCELLASVSCE